MTVSSSLAYKAYSGNGVTTAFPTTFQFFDNTDLVVTSVVDATGVETVKTLTTHYTVSGGSGSTGTVTMLTAPASGTTLVIERSTARTQGVDYVQNDDFPAEVTEDAFDKLTLLAQENARDAQSSPTLPITFDPATATRPEIPLPEAGKMLIGNDDEDGWDNVELSDLDLETPVTLYPGIAVGDSLRWDGAAFANVSTYVTPEDFGAVGNGIANDTDAVNDALATGKCVILTKTYLVSNLTMSVARTALIALGNARIYDAASTTGSMVTVSGEDCAVRGLAFTISQSSGLTDAVLVRANGVKISDLVITGQLANPLLPSVTAYPLHGIRVQGASAALYTDLEFHRIRVNGCNNGMTVQGGVRLDASFLNFYNQTGMGMVLGNTLPSTNVKIAHLRGINCGQYAFSLSLITTAAATWPRPYENLEFTGMYAENCGWRDYYSGVNSTDVGGGKFGFDLTSTGIHRMKFDGVAVNCAAGGAELKFGAPSGITLIPAGIKNNRVDLDTYLIADKGWGLLLCPSGAADLAGSLANAALGGRGVYVGARAWAAATEFKPYDVVVADSDQWLCFGTSAGLAGTSGVTTPTGGTAVKIATNAQTLSGSAVLNFADTTGVAAGMVVFAGTPVPDGATVLSTTATTVTVSAAATSTLASGRQVIFATKCSDGTLNWIVLGADPGTYAANTVGLEIRSSSGVSAVYESINNRYGVSLNPFQTVGETISDLMLKARVRGATYGIADTANSDNDGIISGLVLDGCDVEASGNALSIGSNTSGTVSLIDKGGRYRQTGASGDAFITGGGTVTASFHGTSFYGPSKAVNLSASSTHAIRSIDCMYETPSGGNIPININGAGTWKFVGSNSVMNGEPTNHPGWRTSSGAIAVTGRLLRLDRTTAPHATDTIGNIGEFIELAAPTATVDGYVCRAADFGAPTFTWEERVLA